MIKATYIASMKMTINMFWLSQRGSEHTFLGEIESQVNISPQENYI